MTDIVPGIVTFGLGGDHSNLIVGNIVTLGSITVEITPVPPPTGGGGGPYPGPAWNKVDDITNFYNPVEDQYYQPTGKIPVIIKVTYKDKTVEKTYIVTANRHDVIVKVLSMLNVTVSRISIAVKNIKNRTAKVFAKITNVRNKSDE